MWREVQRIFAALDHPSQPIQRRLHVAAPLSTSRTTERAHDRLLKSRRYIVMLFPAVIVANEPLRHRALDHFPRNLPIYHGFPVSTLLLRVQNAAGAGVRQIQRHSRVAVAAFRDYFQYFARKNRLVSMHSRGSTPLFWM